MLWSTVPSDQAIKETVQIAQCPQTGTQQTTKWVSSLTARVVSRQALTLHSFADRSWTAGSMDVFTSGVVPNSELFRRRGSNPAFQLAWKMKRTPGAGAWLGRAFHGMSCALPNERTKLLPLHTSR